MAYDSGITWGVVGWPWQLAADERGAWEHLIGATTSYPTGEYHPPLRAARRADKARSLAAFTWEYDAPEVLTARPTALLWAAGEARGRVELPEDAAGAAEALAGVLARPELRQRTVASWGAADAGFHAFLRHLARPLVRLGFTIEPVATGTRCKAIIIRKGRRAWWLTDAQEMVGGATLTQAAFVEEYAPRSRWETGDPARLAEALGAFQRQLLGLFGVSLRMTIGAAALRAAQQFVPGKAWLWRCPPLLVSMLREGHGMRGGYTYAERHDGAAWRVDINKAYTGALATALPARAALVRRPPADPSVEGVYLCRVSGPGRLPAYLAPWRPKERAFVLDYWNGSECLAVLTTAELPGLRALGFRVEELGGFAFVRTWTLAPFVERIAAICEQHGRGSAHERTAKLIGNAVYGKLAERPERVEVMYAETRPAPGWRPMLTERGDEVPDCWTREVVTHRPGQHVDVAAAVTGRVRAQLLDAAATVLALGGRVVHADTDGLLATLDPSDYLDTHDTRPGSWRVEREPQRAIVWARKGYAFGDEVRAAGFAGLGADDAAQLAAGETVETTYKTRGAPWSGGAPLNMATKRARATA